MSAFAETLNTFANLAIVLGYLMVPVMWLPLLPLTRGLRFAGATFFLTCALTHLAMAFGMEHARLLVVNHLIQAAAVFWFVFGFWGLLRSGRLTSVTPPGPDAESGHILGEEPPRR